MFFRTSSLALWIATATGLIGCGREPATHDGGVVDDLGRSVRLERPAQRIVSLSPAITELLFAIGAGGRVVGRTQWGKYPAAVADVPNVGDGLNPNVEALVARRPDLVAFYASNANEQVIDRLTAIGIPSVSVRLDSLASVSRAARVLGALAGVAGRADRLADAFDAQLDSARRAPRPPRGHRVAILTWDNPPIIIGAGSFLSELVDLAGSRNVFDDIPGPSATVAIETIAARDPDVFLTFSEGLPAFAERPEWQTIAAVRRRRFVHAIGSEFEYPSPRALEAVRRLREALEAVPR